MGLVENLHGNAAASDVSRSSSFHYAKRSCETFIQNNVRICPVTGTARLRKTWPEINRNNPRGLSFSDRGLLYDIEYKSIFIFDKRRSRYRDRCQKR